MALPSDTCCPSNLTPSCAPGRKDLGDNPYPEHTYGPSLSVSWGAPRFLGAPQETHTDVGSVGSGPREVLGGRIRRSHRSTCRITEELGPQILCQLIYSPLFISGAGFFLFFFNPSLAFYALIINCTHSLHNGSSDQVMNASSHQHQLEPSTPATTMSCSPQP